MKGHSIILGAALLFAGCSASNDKDLAKPDQGLPSPGGVGLTTPLSLDSDLMRQKVAKATCTRGNSFAKISVDAAGRMEGSLTDTERKVVGTLVSRDTKTVELTVERGTLRGGAVGETMQITTDGRRVYLTGKTFVCRGVEIRPTG